MRALVQVVVVLLMIVIGISLFIAWVDKFRDDAAAIQCTNNLKQISLAIHGFHDTYKVLPPGTHWYSTRSFSKERTNLPVEHRASWLFIISHYVEAMMDPNWRIDPKKSWKAPENQYVAKAVMSVYLCPSADLDLYNVTNYIGIAGVGKDAAILPLGDPRVGCVGYERLISFHSIKDGTSNTICILETMRDVGPWIAGGYTTVRGLDPQQPPYLGEDGQFTSGHWQSGLWSRHMWINAAFADGSVRSFRDSLDPKILEALATIAGGEQVEIPE